MGLKPARFALSEQETDERLPIYVNGEGLRVEIVAGYESYELYITHELGSQEAGSLFNAIATYTKEGYLEAIEIKFPHHPHEDTEESWISNQSPTIGLLFNPESGLLAKAALLPDKVLLHSNESFLTSPQDLTPKTAKNKTTLTFTWEPQQANYRCVLSTYPEDNTHQLIAYRNVGPQDKGEEILFSLTLPHKIDVQQLEKALENPRISQAPESLNFITYNGPKVEY